MLFRSKAPGHIAICRPEEADYMMGFKRVTKRQLEADFGQSFGSEQIVEDVHTFSGANFSVAAISGGTFDTEIAQQANNWTDDERKIVEQRLTEFANDPRHRGEVWLYEPPKVVAPWPTYDDMHHNTIPERAEEMGLVMEALIYEQRTKARPVVMEKLQAKLERASQEADLVAQT